MLLSGLSPRQVHEISKLLNYLATDKAYNKNAKELHCGLMNTTLIYEKGDTYAKSVGTELKDVFALSKNSTDRSILMKSHEYEFELDNQNKVKEEIIDWIKNDFKLTKINDCTVMQTVVFIPGAYTLNDPGEIIKYISKNLPDKVNFIGNITVGDILSSESFKSDISKIKPDFYKRAYIVAPYSILDFLPSHFTPEKPVVNEKFFEKIIKNEEDILDIQWRKISGADSIFAFTKAVVEYSNDPQKNRKKPVAEAIRDIIRREEPVAKRFSADGFFGKIEFDGHERRNIKKGTALKYIPYQDQDKKMALVPLDYRNRNDLSKDIEKYNILKFEDFVPQKTDVDQGLIPSKP
jgi:hypothetical protein